MSQQKNGSDLQAGAVATLGGSGLMYLAGVAGEQLNANAAAGHTAVLDIFAGTIPTGLFGMGAAATVWGAHTLYRRLNRRGRVRARYDNPGWADWMALRKHLSPVSTIKVAGHTRPSYKHITWWNRAWHLRQFRNALDVTDHGVYLGESVVGPAYARRLYASYRDVILAIAPPQSGKTAWLMGAIIDAAGAVVATSTKHDIYEMTHHLRSGEGRPVLLFNPAGLGALESTLRWNPVRGCDDYATAQSRAASMTRGVRAMRQSHSDDSGFWEDQATKVLRCFLMAAALTEQGMDTVAKWVATPTNHQALEILREHSNRVPTGWVGELRQVVTTEAEKTRDSIFLTLSQSMQFMANPAVAAIVAPGQGENALDLDTFIASRGTLYLLGDDKSLAPLLVALTQHLFEGAKVHASRQPGGRLDPPMSFILDEAALIVPVDLTRWVADAGGRNIAIIIAAQALAQLYEIYGERGGQVVKTAANTQLYFGGLTLTEDLNAIAEACGTYVTKQHTETEGERRGRSTSTTEVRRPTIEPALVREIPEHHALVLHRTAPPTLIRTTPAWERRDVKRAQRAARKAASIPAQRVDEVVGEEPVRDVEPERTPR
ncbi:type IV secretory system conjugative DNA transfer family protein [Micromonospora sp. RV43]|uniref:type IV secretory system conjugative DNA transfer family protein n=1 Tax=Micromonospora sp. RV43 TaxID=1661387 RepID=UPI00064C358D|nr:type IV secretory system conjugative DNA transfer family protein [Micromonospora sp. RV43]